MEFLYDFISQHRFAVVATGTKENRPEAALVGFAVTEDLRIIFDTSDTSRKYDNLINNPFVAIVIGWENERTVQYEGIAHMPDEAALQEMLPVYFSVFPDGQTRREKDKHIRYFVIDPEWIRYADFNEPVKIEEMNFSGCK